MAPLHYYILLYVESGGMVAIFCGSASEVVVELRIRLETKPVITSARTTMTRPIRA